MNDVQSLRVQRYFPFMIAAEIISATLGGGDNSKYRFSRENNLLNWNNSSVKNLRIVVYTIKLEQVAEPLIYAPENNLYRSALSLLYFFRNVQSIARRFSSAGSVRAYHDDKRKTEGRLERGPCVWKPRAINNGYQSDRHHFNWRRFSFSLHILDCIGRFARVTFIQYNSAIDNTLYHFYVSFFFASEMLIDSR